MSIASAASRRPSPRRSFRPALAGIPRTARIVLVAAGTSVMALGSVGSAAAQAHDPQPRSWEARVVSGAFVPTGDHALFLRHARVHAAQLSWLVRPRVALSGTVAWARSRDLGAVDAPRLDVFTYDLGVEARSAARLGGGPVAFRAFAGVGAGVRSYNPRGASGATSNPAGYGSIGGEIGIRRVALRLEVRNYLTGFKPLVGAGPSRLRSDLAFMAALRFNRHHASPK